MKLYRLLNSNLL